MLVTRAIDDDASHNVRSSSHTPAATKKKSRSSSHAHDGSDFRTNLCFVVIVLRQGLDLKACLRSNKLREIKC
ncbi:hypothetical protein HanIR_Chr09g0416201 [Helianthus annuus]|nr:hypothetical protein HanIR_Chr09g0416201 [Helianthus annuus]